MKVQPHQCLGAIWGKSKERPDVAGTVKATIDQFNAVSFRVLSTVLSDIELRPVQRAKIIARWIEIAQVSKCLVNVSAACLEYFNRQLYLYRLLLFYFIIWFFSNFILIIVQYNFKIWFSIFFRSQELRLLKNFSSLKAIVSALQSTPIYRLKKVWAAVPKEKV